MKSEEKSKTGAAIADLNGVYWFLEHKSQIKTRENVYIITIMSQDPQ